MPYATEDDVYFETGWDSAIVVEMSGLAAGAVTTMIEGWISDAEAEINKILGAPETVFRELHRGTGEDDEFDLGPLDELGFYEDYDPENNTVQGEAFWLGNIRRKRPYPLDADQTESIAASTTVSNCVASNETTIVAAGSNSLKMIFSAAGWVRYPTAQNLNKNIDIFEFVSFRFYASSATVTFSLRLYDVDGNYNVITFTVDAANIWYIVHFDLDESSWTGTIDWDDTRLYYWELHADGACTAYLDNLNFNDGWFVTAPQGKLVIPHMSSDEPLPDGYCTFLSYSINEFLSSTPRYIKTATACFAGIALCDYLIGRRQRDTAFLIESDTLIRDPDKETLYHKISRLKARAEKALRSHGYTFDFVGVQV